MSCVDTVYCWDSLDTEVSEYLKNKTYEHSGIDFKTLPKISRELDLSEDYNDKLEDKLGRSPCTNDSNLATKDKRSKGPSSPQTAAERVYDAIRGMPSVSEDDFNILKSSESVHLSDEGAEFVVSCVKHVLPNFIVLQVGIPYFVTIL